jgi:pSer/pThr/pTyr-binding forkhead associated (FHA) protein
MSPEVSVPSPAPLVVTLRDGVPVGLAFELTRREQVERVPITQARVVVGRVPSADLVIASDSVSRRHSAYDFSSGEAFIEDLHSTGGTFVNHERITGRRLLREGDWVRFGGTVVRIVSVAPSG